MRPNCKILNALRLSACVVPLLMTSGCMFNDMANDTHEMRQKTGDMAATTSKMSDTTSEMSKQTEQMNEQMVQMRQEMADLKTETTQQLQRTVMGLTDTYSDLRQKEAVDMRNTMLDTLEKTSSLESKVAAAGKYCMAFEFQLWKDNLNDTPEYREQLFRDAIEEFFLDLARYMPDPSESLDSTSTKSQMQNLMAIAATIDRANPNAQVLAKSEHREPDTLWSLIESALNKADKVESGEISHDDLKPYEQQVLIYKSEAVAILQARANMLPVMLLSRISDIQNQSLPMQAWMAYHGSTAQFNSIESMRQGLKFISDASLEIDFLRSHGYPARIGGTLKAIYNNMTVPQPGQSVTTLSLPKKQQATRTAVEKDLYKAIDDFKKAINHSDP